MHYEKRKLHKLHSIPIDLCNKVNHKRLYLVSYSIPLSCMVVLLLGFSVMINPGHFASQKSYAVEMVDDEQAELTTSDDMEDDVNNGMARASRASTPSLALSVTNSDKVIETVQGGSTAYSDHLVTISGQELTNYTLSMSSSSANLTKPSGASGAEITGAGGVTGGSMPANRWGYAVTEENNSSYGGLTYNTVPTSSATIASGNAAADGTLNTKKKIVIAARFGEDAASGTYRQSINLSAVATAMMVTYTINFSANGGSDAPTVTAQTSSEDSVSFTLPGQGGMNKSGYSFLGWSTSSSVTTASYTAGSSYTVSRSNPAPTLYAVWKVASFNTNITTMQQMTPAICQNADIGATKVLTDNRSGYASGTMTSPGGITHNMNQYVVMKMLDGTCWMGENLRIMNTTINSTYSDMTSGSFTIPASNKSGFTSSDKSSPKAYYEDTTYGAYYNWYTATAGTAPSGSGDVASSICPKGWKLPAYSGVGSFYNIINGNGTAGTGYKDSKGSFTVLNSKNGRILGYNSNDAFWPAAGFVRSGSLASVGSFGDYWSRRASTAGSAYVLGFDSSGVYPQDGSGRYYGCSVRCVAAQ